MAITDIFSKRQKRLRGEMPDIYVYDNLPDSLKVQIIQIWRQISLYYNKLGRYNPHAISVYERIVSVLHREYGLFRLCEPDFNSRFSPEMELEKFFFEETNIDKSFDAIELFFSFSSHIHAFDDIVTELNQRFKEHGVGYQYENGQIIRINSQFIHAEVVKPALKLLNNKCYAGAEQEFLKAHEHYRNGHLKETLNECLKSFESVMKIVCTKKGWRYSNNSTSNDLIQICLRNDLIPLFWQGHFSALETLLRSSIPTARNKLSGHGQGPAMQDVPEHLVSYVLHMTASAIVFLVQSEKNL